MDLQELSDRTEINDVLVRYTRAIDTGDWDRLDTVFTPDAQIDYTESGGMAAGFAEVKPWLAEVLPAFFPKRMFHPLVWPHPMIDRLRDVVAIAKATATTTAGAKAATTRGAR